MNPIPSLHCPYCQNPAQVERLACGACEVKLEGPFQPNEFAYLKEDDLHFLRIFLECEGRIRDMEAPLGLSYPTIRTRLATLKEKVLRLPSPPATPTKSALDALADGTLSYEETLMRLKKGKKEKK